MAPSSSKMASILEVRATCISQNRSPDLQKRPALYTRPEGWPHRSPDLQKQPALHDFGNDNKSSLRTQDSKDKVGPDVFGATCYYN